MLAEIARPDGRRARFEHDAFARRTKTALVAVSADGTETVDSETRFVWDAHTVLQELDSERGATTWYWEPGTFTPVLKERNEQRWSIASDHHPDRDVRRARPARPIADPLAFIGPHGLMPWAARARGARPGSRQLDGIANVNTSRPSAWTHAKRTVGGEAAASTSRSPKPSSPGPR